MLHPLLWYRGFLVGFTTCQQPGHGIPIDICREIFEVEDGQWSRTGYVIKLHGHRDFYWLRTWIYCLDLQPVSLAVNVTWINAGWALGRRRRRRPNAQPAFIHRSIPQGQYHLCCGTGLAGAHCDWATGAVNNSRGESKGWFTSWSMSRRHPTVSGLWPDDQPVKPDHGCNECGHCGQAADRALSDVWPLLSCLFMLQNPFILMFALCLSSKTKVLYFDVRTVFVLHSSFILLFAPCLFCKTKLLHFDVHIVLVLQNSFMLMVALCLCCKTVFLFWCLDFPAKGLTQSSCKKVSECCSILHFVYCAGTKLQKCSKCDNV